MLFTDKHEKLRLSISEFVDTEINPYTDEWEKKEIFPAHELFKKMGDLGFLGLSKPTEFGGMGLDYSYEVVFSEEMGRINCGGVPMGIGVQTAYCTPALTKFGSDELRHKFLAPSIAGDMVGCIGVSEIGAGSDVASIQTTARKDGGDYVINGNKMWITSGTQADWICLLANTGSGPVHRNKSLICVPLNSKGVTIGKKLKKLGVFSSDTAQILFEDVRVPRRYRIGEENEGFVHQMSQFQEERLYAATSQIKTFEKAIKDTIEYTRSRKAFGKSIIDNQYVQFRLAELQTEVEMLRSIVYRSAELYMNGENVTSLACMAKLKSGRLNRKVFDVCLQFWGGKGYLWETPISRSYRDGRLKSIGGGPDEIMLTIISKHMGMLHKSKR